MPYKHYKNSIAILFLASALLPRFLLAEPLTPFYLKKIAFLILLKRRKWPSLGVAIKTKPVLARPAKEGSDHHRQKVKGLKLFRSQPKRSIGLYKIFVQQQVMRKKFWSER